METTHERFEKEFPKLIYDGDETGGYDAKPYILSFIEKELTLRDTNLKERIEGLMRKTPIHLRA